MSYIVINNGNRQVSYSGARYTAPEAVSNCPYKIVANKNNAVVSYGLTTEHNTDSPAINISGAYYYINKLTSTTTSYGVTDYTYTYTQATTSQSEKQTTTNTTTQSSKSTSTRTPAGTANSTTISKAYTNYGANTFAKRAFTVKAGKQTATYNCSTTPSGYTSFLPSTKSTSTSGQTGGSVSAYSTSSSWDMEYLALTSQRYGSTQTTSSILSGSMHFIGYHESLNETHRSSYANTGYTIQVWASTSTATTTATTKNTTVTDQYNTTLTRTSTPYYSSSSTSYSTTTEL